MRNGVLSQAGEFRQTKNMSKIINNTFPIFLISLFVISFETTTTFDIDRARSHIDEQNKKYMEF
jgi:hypothetical protein